MKYRLSQFQANTEIRDLQLQGIRMANTAQQGINRRIQDAISQHGLRPLHLTFLATSSLRIASFKLPSAG
jgi:hypothetical protein